METETQAESILAVVNYPRLIRKKCLEPNFLICEECGKTFSQKSSLSRHQKISHTENWSEFYECGCNFAQKKLRRHIKDGHIFPKCDLCGDEFSTINILRRHQKDVHMIQQQIMECKLCQKNFSSEQNFKRHLACVHSERIGRIQQFDCDKCKKSFKRKDSLLRHLKVCYMLTEYSLECPNCSREFLRKDDFRRHIRSFHNKDKENKAKKKKCPLCEQSFRLRKDVERHLPDAHNINLAYENLEFASFAAFEKYKEQMPFVQLIKGNSWETETHKTRYFRCHRSGKKPSKMIFRKRFEKISGSKKLDSFCPMKIVVKESKINGICSVECQNVHVGHSLSKEELRYISRNKLEKLTSATKMRMGVPLTPVLKRHETGNINFTNYIKKICPARNRLRRSHKEAENQMNREKEKQMNGEESLLVIKCIGSFVWQVGSLKNNNDNVQEMYTVQKYVEKECAQNTDCQLRCPVCRICSHEFFCSCLDSTIKKNMCKHIHMIILGNYYDPATECHFDQGNDDEPDDGTHITDNSGSVITNCDGNQLHAGTTNSDENQLHADSDLKTYKKNTVQQFLKTLNLAQSKEEVDLITKTLKSVELLWQHNRAHYNEGHS